MLETENQTLLFSDFLNRGSHLTQYWPLRSEGLSAGRQELLREGLPYGPIDEQRSEPLPSLAGGSCFVMHRAWSYTAEPWCDRTVAAQAGHGGSDMACVQSLQA